MDPTPAPQGQPPPVPANPGGQPSFMDRQFGGMSGCGQWFIIILFPFIGLVLGVIGLLACREAKARSRAGTMALVGGIWFAISLLIMFGQMRPAAGGKAQEQAPKIDMQAFYDSLQFSTGIGDLDVAERTLRDVGVNRRGENGATLLGVAAFHRDTNVVQLLVAAGADVNAKDDDGLTPLMQAMLMGSDIRPTAGVIDLLLANGADLQARNNEGDTVLGIAANHGVLEAVKVLVAKGADIHARNNQGWTPLKSASYQRKTDVVQFLKEQGASE